MQTLTTRLTYVEWLRSPQSERPSEFVDGRAIEVNPPSGRHILINKRIASLLDDHFRSLGIDYISLFGVGVETEDEGKIRCRIPDLVVCTAEQASILEDGDGIFKLGNPPKIVIEILSPSTKDADNDEKRREYRRAEVPEYWIIDPATGNIQVMTLVSGYQVRGLVGSGSILSDELPKLELTADEVFRR